MLSKVSYAIDLFSPHSMGGKIGADLAKVTCFKECENRPVQANAGSNLPPPDGQLDPLCGAYKLTMADMTCDTASVAMGIAVLAACTPACLNPILYPAPYCTIASRASDASRLIKNVTKTRCPRYEFKGRCLIMMLPK